MWNIKFIIPVLVVIFSRFSRSLALECVKIDRCSCKFDDGSGTVNLTQLGKETGPPLIYNVNVSDYAYSFNPCYPFNEGDSGSCTNVSGCQAFLGIPALWYDIGDPDSVNFTYDGSDLIGTYQSSDKWGKVRRSVVTYHCDPSADKPVFSVSGETNISTYTFRIASRYACRVPEASVNCTQLDNCACEFTDGRGVVDLSTIGKHGTPLIHNVKSGEFEYSFNPCFHFNEGTCTYVAACQKENTTGYFYNIGDAIDAKLIYDGNNVIGIYSGYETRQSFTTYVCDEDVDTPITVVNGELSSTTYGFTIISKELCPRKELTYTINSSKARPAEVDKARPKVVDNAEHQDNKSV